MDIQDKTKEELISELKESLQESDSLKALKEKLEAELIIANKALIFQNEEKEKRAAELIIANKELLFQNEEKEKRAAELIIANKELLFQNEEKEKRAAELIIANKELAFQNKEKAKRAAELIIANKELAFQNEEKGKLSAELIIALANASDFENKFRQIAENINDVFWLRTHSEMIYVSPSFEKIWGVPCESIYENPQIFTEIIHPEDKPAVQEIFHSSEFKEKGLFEYKYRIIRLDNEVRWINAKTVPIVDESGQIVKRVGIASDITEKYQTEQELIISKEELEKSEIKYRSYIEGSPEGVLVIDNTGRYIESNKSAFDILGYPEEEITKLTIVDLLAEESMEDGKAHFKKLIETGRATSDLLLKNKNGTKHWLTVNAVKLSETRFLGFVKDITKRKIDEETLRISENNFRSIFESHSAAVAIIEADTTISMVNDSYCKMSGYTREEVIGTSWIKQIPPDDLERLKEYNRIRMLNPAEAPSDYEFTFYHKNGEIKHAMMSVGIISDTKKIITSFIDISERKQAEEESKKAALLLQSSIESPKDMIILSIDKNYKYLYFNECHKVAMVYSYGKDVKIGMNLLDCITNEEDKIKSKINYDKALKGESHITIQEFGDIEKSYYETRYNPVFNDKNEIIGTTAFSANITDRKQAEEKNQKQNVYIKMILDNFPIGIATNEIDSMKVTYMNRKFSEIYGWPEDDFSYVGNFFEKIFPDLEYRQQLQTRILADISSGDSDRMNWDNLKITTKAGEQRIVYAHNIPLLSQNIMVSTVQDITERKQAEESLRKSEEKFSVAFKTSPYAITITNPEDGRFIEVNDAFFSIAGYTPEEAINDSSKGMGLWVDAEDRKSVVKILLGGESIAGQEFQFKKKNGEIITGLFSANLIVIKNKTYILSTINDITERKRAEMIAIKERAISDTIIDSTPGAFYMLDENGRYVHWNAYQRDEIVGKPDSMMPDTNAIDTIHPEDRDLIGSRIENVLKNGVAETVEGRVLLHGGPEFIWMLMTGRPIVIEEKTYLLGIGIDITERKRTAEEMLQKNVQLERQHEEYMQLNEVLSSTNFDLEIAKEHAEESDRLKSAFLANMSHEIRTPMNGILGFAGLLKEPGLSGEEQQNYIKIIEKSGDRMLNIINDIVDISKIEAKLMTVDIKDCNINEKIEFIYIFFKPQVEEKRIQLQFKNTLPAKEAIIRTDNEKVFSILTNLVKNAIKYSKVGTIEFGYKKKDKTLEFYVKDTGIGIPKDRQEAIFERFIQADIEDKMARQGAGLGLSISKAYVEMLGGKIWVESEEGKGSTFYFTLPYNALSEEKQVVQPQDKENHINPEISELKILIAEDDEVSEMLIRIDVEKFSKNVLKARTGNEAIDASRNNPDIDLILMDILMPVMNGYEATRQIRQFNKDVIIIAQTAFGLSGDREKAIEAGCNDYISKPINMEKLLSIIQKNFNK